MIFLDDVSKGGPKPWLEGIEGDAACELIESDDRVIRVVAGPGSGKTTCLKKRIQRLVQKDKVDPRTIFAGTFTRAIAKELQEALGTEVCVSTLHSLAYDLLRKHPAACQGMHLRFLLRYEEDVMLYDLEQVAAPIDNIYERRNELRLLQACRDKLMTYENAAFAGAVRRWLQRHRGMLIGEVVSLCVTGLKSEDIPSGMFDHVVIDEYQDLTAAEQEFIRMIWSEKSDLTVMGDNDQSIYGFRFNHPEGINDFNVTWPECTDLSFVDNWRCGECILNFANIMMAEAGSKKAPMNSKSGRVGELIAVQWATLDDEINGLAEYINRRSDESFLVLVPRRFIGYRLADAIGLDARTTFTEEILEHSIAREAFTALSLLAAPDDFVSARVWLGLHHTKRKHGARQNTDAYASIAVDIGGHELIRRISTGEIQVTGNGKRNIEKRAKSAVEMIERNMTPEETVNFLFDESLAEEESDDEKRRWLIDDLRELRAAAHELLARQDSSTLAEVVDVMRYRIATRSPVQKDTQEEPRVRIMTLHSAKGLEADNVVIAGVIDQFIPGKETLSTKVAEQKRLLYVSVTRARDSLVMSWSRSVQMNDILGNEGRLDGRIITRSKNKWTKTSRCRLFPQGFSEIISGREFLANISGRCQSNE